MMDGWEDIKVKWPFHNISLLNDGWISLKVCWPIFEDNKYEVKDCRTGIVGTASYDGYQFYSSWNWDNKEKFALVGTMQPTHWRRKRDEP